MLNRLIWGDSFQVIKIIEDGSVDLILTDPPYGVTDLHWDRKINIDKFWAEMNRIIKPSGVIVCFSQQPFTSDLLQANRKNFRYEIIWEKACGTGFLNVRYRPLKTHENILVFSRIRKAYTYNPQMTAGEPYSRHDIGKGSKHWGGVKKVGTINTGLRYPRSVRKFAIQNKGHWHPTQKPYDLINELLVTYSNPGDLVLDPFAGSCVVAHSAINNNRNFIAIEKDLDYCKRAAAELDLTLCRVKQSVA